MRARTARTRFPTKSSPNAAVLDTCKQCYYATESKSNKKVRLQVTCLGCCSPLLDLYEGERAYCRKCILPGLEGPRRTRSSRAARAKDQAAFDDPKGKKLIAPASNNEEIDEPSVGASAPLDGDCSASAPLCHDIHITEVPNPCSAFAPHRSDTHLDCEADKIVCP